MGDSLGDDFTFNIEVPEEAVICGSDAEMVADEDVLMKSHEGSTAKRPAKQSVKKVKKSRMSVYGNQCAAVTEMVKLLESLPQRHRKQKKFASQLDYDQFMDAVTPRLVSPDDAAAVRKSVTKLAL